MRPSRTNPPGWKPGIPASHGSRPEYDVSMCPLNMSDGPPPVPSQSPTTFGRPSSTCCHCTWSPIRSNSSRTRSPIACSSPVGLEIETRSTASETRRPSSTCAATSGAEMRQHLFPEEPDLLVPPVAPELEHHVRAAGVTVLLDRLDAVARRPGDRPALVEDRVRHLGLGREPPAALHRLRDGPDLVLLEAGELEQRVGRALDVLDLVREVHGRDLARAVAALVAVEADRGDDRAAEVGLG